LHSKDLYIIEGYIYFIRGTMAINRKTSAIFIVLIILCLLLPTIASAYTTQQKEDVILNIYGGLGFTLEVINNGETPVSVNYSMEWYRYSTNKLIYWMNGTMYNISSSLRNRFFYSHLRSPLMRLNVTMYTENQGITRTGIVIFILRIFLTEERY
jgi:hypothetical protein